MPRVKIDGVETTLRYDSHSGNRGHQYLTPGNRASHAFPWRLEHRAGQAFRINGHDYVVLGGSTDAGSCSVLDRATGPGTDGDGDAG